MKVQQVGSEGEQHYLGRMFVHLASEKHYVAYIRRKDSHVIVTLAGNRGQDICHDLFGAYGSGRREALDVPARALVLQGFV